MKQTAKQTDLEPHYLHFKSTKSSGSNEQADGLMKIAEVFISTVLGFVVAGRFNDTIIP